MSLSTSQQLIREAIQRTADVVAFTDRHTPESINLLINRGLGALSTLCRTTNPEFQPVGSTIITADGLATAFALPANFRSLLSLEYTGDGGLKTWLEPYEWFERPMLTDPVTQASSIRARYYKILGSNIELLPIPPKNHQALIWYATSVTQFSTTGGDAQTFDTMERLDTYVIWWAAREIAMEREAWERHDRLDAKLKDLEGDIRILARSIDLGQPGRMTDHRYANWYGRRRFYR